MENTGWHLLLWLLSLQGSAEPAPPTARRGNPPHPTQPPTHPHLLMPGLSCVGMSLTMSGYLFVLSSLLRL